MAPMFITTVTCPQPAWSLTISITPGSGQLDVTGYEGSGETCEELVPFFVSADYWQTHLPSGDGRGWKAFSQMTDLSPVTPLRLFDRFRIVEELSAIPASLADKEVPETPSVPEVPPTTTGAESQVSTATPQKVTFRLVLVQSTDDEGHLNLITYRGSTRHACTLTTLTEVRQALLRAGQGDWALLDGLCGELPTSVDRTQLSTRLWSKWLVKDQTHRQWLDRHLPLVYQPATIEVPCVHLGAPGPRDQLGAQIMELDARFVEAVGQERQQLSRQLQDLQKQIGRLPVDKRQTCTLTIRGPTAEQLVRLADAPPGPIRQACYKELFDVGQQELEDGRMLLVSEGRPYVVAQDTMRRVIDRLTELHDPMDEEDC